MLSTRIFTRHRLVQQVHLLAADADGPKKKQTKVKKKNKKAAAAAGVDTAGQKNLRLVLDSLDAQYRQEEAISNEEKEHRAMVAKNYTIGRFRQHNEVDHDITCKLYLKQHAIKMMKGIDPMLIEEAMKVNNDQPPAWRDMPVWTPPIAGFDPDKYLKEEEED